MAAAHSAASPQCPRLGLKLSRLRGDRVTFVEVSIVLCVLGKGEAVGDLQPVLHHQAKQHTLYHFTALTLLLVVLDYFQDHLRNGERGRKGLVCDREHVCVCLSACFQ